MCVWHYIQSHITLHYTYLTVYYVHICIFALFQVNLRRSRKLSNLNVPQNWSGQTLKPSEIACGVPDLQSLAPLAL